MKNIRKYSCISLLIGAAITLASALLPMLSLSNGTVQSGSVEIIGGADVPTYAFLAHEIWGGVTIYTFTFGVTLMIASLFCVIFHKTVEKHCALKTTILSLSLSFVGTVGLVCLFTWFSIVAFHEMSKHPISYPASLILGLLSFVLFIVLIMFYCEVRKKKFSVKGILVDIATSVLTLPLFFFICAKIFDILEQVF